MTSQFDVHHFTFELFLYNFESVLALPTSDTTAL
jgi:hypothetical protein